MGELLQKLLRLGISLTLAVLAQAEFIQYNYKKIDYGQSINGTLQGRYMERSKIECSLRCSTDNLCTAYLFNGSTTENCGVIHGNATEEDVEQFTSGGRSVVFKKDFCAQSNQNMDGTICKNGGTCVDGINSYRCDCTDGFSGIHCEDELSGSCGSSPCQNGGVCTGDGDSYNCSCGSNFDGIMCQHECNGSWTVPDGWTGSQPVVYRNLDHSVGLKSPSQYGIVSGKICKGIKTADSPGVNLGDLSAACITRPATCGSDGGTVSLWLKVESCDHDGGALTTSDYFEEEYYPYPTEGFIIACHNTKLQYRLVYPGRSIYKRPSRPEGWFHTVMTIKGDNLKVYHNKIDVDVGTSVDTYGHEADGQSDTVIGEYFADYTWRDSTVIADELAMWNRALSESEVAQIYDATCQ